MKRNSGNFRDQYMTATKSGCTQIQSDVMSFKGENFFDREEEECLKTPRNM